MTVRTLASNELPRKEADTACDALPPSSCERRSDEAAAATHTLPQPLLAAAAAQGSQDYVYVTNDDLMQTCFPTYGGASYPKDALFWVLTSKGKRSRRDPDDATTPTVVGGGNNRRKSPMLPSDGGGLKTQLFQRARVVQDDDEDDDGPSCAADKRVVVRYPKGSTYRVKKSMLIPVLERGRTTPDRIVLVLPETPEYRRAAAVHTCVGDTFLEIGCDFGPTIDRVQRVLLKKSGVPLDWDDTTNSSDNTEQPAMEGETHKNNDNNDPASCRVVAIGIDKSPVSISVAEERYPDSVFSLEDALTEQGTAKIRSLCQDKLVGRFPSVVGVDINGNRELPAVLKCLEWIMCPGGIKEDKIDIDKADSVEIIDGVNWDIPRLIVVKSRSLYLMLKERRKLDLPMY